MIEKKSLSDLALLYKLSKRGDPVNSLTYGRFFAGYIETTGQKINDDVKDPIGKMPILNNYEDYTKRFLELKSYMDEITVGCFTNDIYFQNQRDNGLKHALNQNEKCPGFFATFLDFQYVKGI
jgi:hypothetical protein